MNHIKRLFISLGVGQLFGVAFMTFFIFATITFYAVRLWILDIPIQPDFWAKLAEAGSVIGAFALAASLVVWVVSCFDGIQ